MVLINGRKFACEACIRGHRASSCAHTNRQLQLVRKKGRPASQCDICRSKRISSSFHGRCDCNVDEEEASSVASGSSRVRRKVEAKIEKFTPYADVWLSDEKSGSPESQDGQTKGKHSLDLLMNPCQCRSTGVCSCCNQTKQVATLATEDEPASCGCNGGDKCCNDGVEKCEDEVAIDVPTGVMMGCCGGGKSKPDQDLSLPTLLSGAISAEHASILQPECQCGANCSCPGCINDRNSPRIDRPIDEDDDCPNKCFDCSACVLGLTRPSGIDVVDQWMEQDKKRVAAHEADHNGRTSSKKSRSGPSVEQFILSNPFSIASRFHDQHFNDPQKRQYFAEHLNAVRTVPNEQVVSNVPRVETYGERLTGESSEQWQVRHGFNYLTPESVEIFDHARKFKRQKALAERAQEQKQERPPSPASEDLNTLRVRALSTRKGGLAVPKAFASATPSS